MEDSITAELLQELYVNQQPHEHELAADRGDNAIVTAATRKKNKKSLSPEEAASAVRVREVARVLSKKNQKRVEQIRKRKVTEMKLGDYLGVINSHQITDTQRVLLTSSKQVGQSLSLKQLISSIYHKEKFGLSISNEERELLYHNRSHSNLATSGIEVGLAGVTAHDVDMGVIDHNPTISHSMEQQSSTAGMVPDGLLFSFDDIFEKKGDADTTKSTKKTDSKKKVRRAAGRESKDVTDADKVSQSISAAIEQPAPQLTSAAASNGHMQPSGVKSSVGAGLLSQLMRIKECNASKGAQPASELQSGLLEVESDTPATSKYVVQETAIPVTARGEIVAPHPLIGDEARDQQPPKVAMSVVKLQRSVDVQAARMQLPICAMEQEIVEAIRSDLHDALVLCGETGSGKSTQVPTFC